MIQNLWFLTKIKIVTHFKTHLMNTLTYFAREKIALPLKLYLHYGKIMAQLEGFKETKKSVLYNKLS